MALIGDLDEAALAALTTRVKARITTSTVGMSAAPDATATEIASAADCFRRLGRHFDDKDDGREAAVRLAGRLSSS